MYAAAMLQSILLGSHGEAVADWQYFLLGRGLYKLEVDGEFGPATESATKTFQRLHGVKPVDGWVGSDTYGAALQLGFDPLLYDFASEQAALGVSAPSFRPLTVAQKSRLFGTIVFEDAPTPDNPEGVRIVNGWEKNIEYVPIPQLVGLPGAGRAKVFGFHKKIAVQVQQLFQAWEDAGLTKHILSFGGSWAPRYIRGSRSVLSSHAHGTAFDINVAWNQYGHRPALRGKEGSVLPLVPIAHERGMYWGGHFSRKDGQHFEVAVLP